MKAVKTIDLEAETETAAKPARRGKKPSALIRRTFSIYGEDDKLINDTASVLSKKKGKPVGASEALRHLLAEARDA